MRFGVPSASTIGAAVSGTGRSELVSRLEDELLQRFGRGELDGDAGLVHGLADLVAVEVGRPLHAEMAVIGDAPMAGLGAGRQLLDEGAVRRHIHRISRAGARARAGAGVAHDLVLDLRRGQAVAEALRRLRPERRRFAACGEREARHDHGNDAHASLLRRFAATISELDMALATHKPQGERVQSSIAPAEAALRRAAAAEGAGPRRGTLKAVCALP